MIAYPVFVFARAALKVLQAMPLSSVLCLARGLGRVAWWLDAPHRRVALRNVAIAFGKEEPSTGMVRDLERLTARWESLSAELDEVKQKLGALR